MKKLICITLFFLLSSSVFSQVLIDKIPIQLVENLIFFEVKVNNSTEPLNFMFDSGAGVTVIDQIVSDKLNLTISGTTKIGTSGKTIETKESVGNTLHLKESFDVVNASFYLMDLSHISDYLKIKVDGIVGVDFLNQAIVETNIDQMEIRIYEKANYQYPGSTSPLNLVELESSQFGIPVEIKPKGSKEVITLVLKVDTGAANHLTFHNNVILEYKLMDPDKKYKTRQGFGADSTLSSNLISKVSRATLASKEWKNVPVVLEVDPLNLNSKRKGDGLIGQKMLLDFNITYHLDNQAIYLEKRD